MWQSLLDTNAPIDLQLLDKAASQMNSGQPNEEIIRVVEQTAQREDFFSYIDKIISSDYSKSLKYIALTVFKSFVSKNWGDLTPEDAEYYRNLIAQFIMKEFSKDDMQLLYIADTALINILLYEWPNQWPEFINDILSVAQNSPQLCQNALKVIRELVKEFTDFSETSMTSVRQAEMYYAFTNQFDSILPAVLESLSSGNESLIIEALNCIKTFLNVIDSEKLFTQEMINVITNEFLPNPKYMIYCISIISIIPSHHAIFDESFDSFVSLYYGIVKCLEKVFVSDDMYDIKISNGLKAPDFLNIFISSMKKLIRPFILNAPQIEKSEEYALSLKWLFNITYQITDKDPKNKEDFQELAEFWHSLARSLYYDLNSERESSTVYNEYLSYLRRFYLCAMVEPIINNTKVDENDGIHYHKYDLSNEGSTYNYMRETLVFLYHINPDDTIEAISERLEEIKSSPSVESINSFSWAIGGIPGTITEAQELTIISEILQTFMSMAESLSSEEALEDRTSVTRAILHICSQYGQLLSKHFELLKVVLNKMVEFAQETNQQIQDSAVQALTQISRYARNLLATRQKDEEQSFLEMLLANIQPLLQPLSQDNIISMIEFFSFLITDVSSDRTRREMTSSIADIINEKLPELSRSIDFDDSDWFSNFIFIVDCNTQIITNLNITYSKCFFEIYQNFVQVYQAASEKLNSLADSPDSNLYNALKKLKSAIVHLFVSFVDSSMCNKEKELNQFAENTLLAVFISDYASSAVKTPEIIGLVSSTCMKMSEFFQSNYSTIMESIVAPSIPLMEDPGDFPEIWPEFNKFLVTYFQQNIDFLSNNNESLMVMYNLLKKSCSHPIQRISEHSLLTLSSLISSVEYSQTQSKIEFFNSISIDAFVFITSLLIDGVHKYLFSNIMNLMRRLIQMDQVQSKLGELMEGLCELLPNRQPKEIHDLIVQMVELSKKNLYSDFKDLIRNFVVVAKKYAPGDPAMYKLDFDEYKKKLEEDNKVRGLVLEKRMPNNQEAMNLAKAFSNFSFQKK